MCWTAEWPSVKGLIQLRQDTGLLSTIASHKEQIFSLSIFGSQNAEYLTIFRVFFFVVLKLDCKFSVFYNSYQIALTQWLASHKLGSQHFQVLSVLVKKSLKKVQEVKETKFFFIGSFVLTQLICEPDFLAKNMSRLLCVHIYIWPWYLNHLRFHYF